MLVLHILRNVLEFNKINYITKNLLLTLKFTLILTNKHKKRVQRAPVFIKAAKSCIKSCIMQLNHKNR